MSRVLRSRNYRRRRVDDIVYLAFAQYAQREIGQDYGDINRWNAALAGALRSLIKAMRSIERDHGGTDYRGRITNVIADISGRLRELSRLPDAERVAQLSALYENLVVHRLALVGTGATPGKPQWQVAVSRLQQGSNESILLNAETALERGLFKASPLADFPIADISGRTGQEDITAHAELRTEIDTEENRRLMADLAERLGNPALGLGPKVQQTFQCLMSFWLTRRSADGYVYIGIEQLAEHLGYARSEGGGYKSRDYDSVREFVTAASMVSVRAVAPAATSTGKGYRDERALNIAYMGDAGLAQKTSASWRAIGFRPSKFLEALATRESAFIKGYDPEVNKLNPVNERGELLLAKYLESHWRLNQNRTPGLVRRKVLRLLTDGMGIDTLKPNARFLNRLEDALDKLQERGTVRHWEADPEWSEVQEALQPTNGIQPRMTRRLWSIATEVVISIESGAAYQDHYREFGKLSDPERDTDARRALEDYQRSSGRSQSAIAQDLGISTSQLSRILRGKGRNARHVSPELQARIDRLTQQGQTLPLPLAPPEP